ncbi:Nesprin-1 [Frankliniella fusca]|uniref:Nesprin-1 n=1 Tax=Frankliniella fusca TaxID=407009 RepID=A0AAE1I095_9NEOP|nr:Nesprin-1 [Frankliniella fusca]
MRVAFLAEELYEQERVQKKTFVNWINSYLSKRVPPLRVDDLIGDLRDGTKLLALLEVLSGEKLPVEKGRNLRRPHFLSNANTALQFLQSKKIKLVNINSSDLVDGRPPVVLGLIWTIILYFQIEENTRALESLGHRFGGSGSSLDSDAEASRRRAGGAQTPLPQAQQQQDRWRQGARRALLHWVNNALPQEMGVEVQDFGKSWRDGHAFVALVHAIRNDLLDVEGLRQAANRVRLESAFGAAERDLGIARLLDPEDVDVERPDEKSVMTYVAQFLHRYPEPRGVEETVPTIQGEFQKLAAWLAETTARLQRLIDSHSLPTEYKEYLAFRDELLVHAASYEKLSKLMASQSTAPVNMDAWQRVEDLWDTLEKQVQQWLWLLDSRLPPPLGEVGQWLAKAERLLTSDATDIPTVMNEETASVISRKLEEHKAFFAELPAVQAKFQAARLGPASLGVPPQQLESIGRRLEEVGPRAAQRRVKLKFLEHKCCLIAFLNLTETKLRGWTGKYGREDHVQTLLEQYANFVSRNRIFQEFNKAFVDMQQVVEEYKREGGVDKRECAAIDRFMRETDDRWQKVSVQLRCVQNMLEEMVAYWRRHAALSQELQDWLQRATHALQRLPEDERQSFFQDLSVWRDKLSLLADTVGFLTAACDEGVSRALRDSLAELTARWDEVFRHVQQYMHAGDLLRLRREFHDGMERLQRWLRGAETVLANLHLELGSAERIKAYGQELQQLQAEVEGMEQLFKVISKTFQSLIQDLSRQEVDTMMDTLKKEKEALVRVRAQIPNQLHLYHQVLVQQESLEAGRREISAWLNEADAVLGERAPSGTREQVQAQLDRHRAFFSRLPYYKSMLDSKVKVLFNMLKSVEATADEHTQAGGSAEQLKQDMTAFANRFATVAQRAQQQEARLQEALRCWQNFREAERVISEWLQMAEKLIGDKHIDTRHSVETHKNFFERVNEQWLQDLVNTAQDLRAALPPDCHPGINATVEQLQAKWKEVLSFAPLHLMRLEFRLDEATFTHYLKEIEKELAAEQQAMNRNQAVDGADGILARNRDFFVERRTLEEAERCLRRLAVTAQAYNKHRPEDASLSESQQRAQALWEGVLARVNEFTQTLKNIPDQWTAYRSKFTDMVRWMDAVDRSLENVLKDLLTIEEFESERAVFQGICREVDSRREDVKWLVQTLDALTATRADSEALHEQRQLEELIARYKNLIPSIEMTVVRTELYSKCYVYTKEVKEVCNLLQKVQESASAPEPHPETLTAVSALVAQQEGAVSQLDSQRPAVVSMLQRGKDLGRDAHAPRFLHEQVAALETGWNQAYQTTLDKLARLRGTQRAWQSYCEQRDALSALLARADAELRSVSRGGNALRVAEELRDKQATCKALREATETMLKRLRDLYAALCAVTAPDTKPVLQREVTEIETRLQTTLEATQLRVRHLEALQARWGQLETRLGDVHTWTVASAPALLARLQAADVEPEQRASHAQTLQQQLAQKATVLGEVEAEAEQLLGELVDGPDAAEVRKRVAGVRAEVAQVRAEAAQQSRAVETDLQQWQRYQTALAEVRPWLEQAEVRVAAGAQRLQRPGTLAEAEDLLQQAKMFERQVAERLTALQELSALSQQLPPASRAVVEVDAARARWAQVQDGAGKQTARLEGVVAEWKDLDKRALAIEEWLTQGEGRLQKAVINVNTPSTAKLQQQLDTLKVFQQEVSSHQAQLLPLAQASEALMHNLTPEGATALKGRLAESRARFTQLAEGVRHKIICASDALLSRQEFQGRLSEFGTWLERLGESSQQIKTLTMTPADAGALLQRTHALLQEHAEHQPTFAAIYEEVKRLSDFSSPEDAQSLDEAYSALSAKYQEMEEGLQGKRVVLERWVELLSWHADTTEALAHVRYQLEGRAEDLELDKLGAELDATVAKLAQWRETAGAIDTASKQSALQVRVQAVELVTALDAQAAALRTQLAARREALRAVGAHWSHFQERQQALSAQLLAAQEAVQKAQMAADRCSRLDAASAAILRLYEQHQATQADRERLHEEGRKLMAEDQANASTVQGILASYDANWDKVSEMLREAKLRYSDLSGAWRKLCEARDRVASGVSEAMAILGPEDAREVPTDITQATMALDRAKKALDHVKKAKGALDMMDSKAQVLSRLAQDVPGWSNEEVEEALSQARIGWQEAHDSAARRIHMLEAQLVIWRQIEEAKSELLQWLSETSGGLTLSGTLSDAETTRQRLARYQEELPMKQSLQASIEAKHEQLVKLNEGRPVPTLDALVRLLREQFAHVRGIAEQLDSAASSLEKQEAAVRAEMKSVGDSVSRVREAVIKCDDLTGDTPRVLERLKTCLKLAGDLQALRASLDSVEKSVSTVKTEFPAFGDNSGLNKELQGLRKRYEGVASHADKVQATLRSFLRKFHADKHGALQRALAALKEKIAWCEPEPSSDRYNLEVKLTSLEELTTGLADCERRQAELVQSLEQLRAVETAEAVTELCSERDEVALDLAGLKACLASVRALLEKGVAQWRELELRSESVATWLKEAEARMRTETARQADLSRLDEHIQEMSAFLKQIEDFEHETEALTKLAEAMTKENPECRAASHVGLLSTRHSALRRTIRALVDQLKTLGQDQKLYAEAVRQAEQWLGQAEARLKSCEEVLSAGTKPTAAYQAQLQVLKDFVGERERGTALVGAAVERGEALLSGVTPETRESVRAELRRLRDASEGLLDRANALQKRVEGVMMQRASLDESTAQVEQWLTEAGGRLGSALELCATLPDKKRALHTVRTLAADAASHGAILRTLEDKTAGLQDADASARLARILGQYKDLSTAAEKRVAVAEKHVTNHEAYLQTLEKARDWLTAFAGEAAAVTDDAALEKDDADEKLGLIKELAGQRADGDALLEACRVQLEGVLRETAPAGHPALQQELDELRARLNAVQAQLQDSQTKLTQLCSRWTKFEEEVDKLAEWVKTKEAAAKDQSLRSSREAKQAYLDKLRALETEILDKGAELNATATQGGALETAGETELHSKVSRLLTRYQALKNAAREAVQRYEAFVREHAAFDDNHRVFMAWLPTVQAELGELSAVIGDLGALQQRQAAMRRLQDVRSAEAAKMDALVEAGERLYAHTSPDGREVVRQQLRTLRHQWDGFSDDLQAAAARLDQCLAQLSDFQAAQEQLTKWLLDVERAMSQHTEKRATLQEKRAQLQNHKMMQQEITSHQQLVEAVCEKAQQLLEQTRDASLGSYLTSIKSLFADIVAKSQRLLDQLEESVRRHAQLSAMGDEFRDWLAKQRHELAALDDVSGEKADLTRRLADLQALQEREALGEKKLAELEEVLTVVAKGTAQKGVDALRQAQAEFRDALALHLQVAATVKARLEEALQQWLQFEQQLDAHTKWFRATEAVFRSQQLQSTLPQKEEQLRAFHRHREEITAREQDIDAFVDRSHALLNLSRAEKVKPLVSQISNRYQLLHVLSKEVVNRWQGLVEDHRLYRDRLAETEAWLGPLEARLAGLVGQRGGGSGGGAAGPGHSGAADAAADAATELQALLAEHEQSEHRLAGLSAAGERLLSDTAAPGREQVRQEMRAVRDRWDALGEQLKEQRKRQDAVSQQWSQFQEALQQTLAWLDAMEKQLQPEQAGAAPWGSIPEVRAKLLKNKTSLQEVLSHKRVVEALTEKAAALAGAGEAQAGEAQAASAGAAQRYERLVDAWLQNITQLEEAVDTFTHFQDLFKGLQEYLKQLQERLSSLTDYTGSKAALQSRLTKLSELQDGLSEGLARHGSLADHVSGKAAKLPPRARETMDRDLASLRFDLERFGSQLEEVRLGVEKRLQQWAEYERALERLLGWLADAEAALKNYQPRATLEEKREQLDKYEALIASLRQNEAELDKISDESSELAQSSGESRVTVSLQQVTSRFQAAQATAKEIVKKCKQAVQDHAAYLDKYRQCSEWLAAAQARFDTCNITSSAGMRPELETQTATLRELMAEQPAAAALLNATVEVGEKLYPSTSAEGREAVRAQLEELQALAEQLFDNISGAERGLQDRISRWSGLEESSDALRRWLSEAEALLAGDMRLHATLDEKRAQLQTYRGVLTDAQQHHQQLAHLRDRADALREHGDQRAIDLQLNALAAQHASILQRAQSYVERYEAIVSNHQQYSKAVMETQEWLEATHHTVLLWGDTDLERISLLTNVERLRGLLTSLPEEEHRIEQIRALAEKVIPGTVEHGQVNVRAQVDSSQQEWEGLLSTLRSTIEALELRVQQWNEYEALREQCLAWLRDTDATLHAVDLKATCQEKKDQLDVLKKLQGAVRAKELEMDSAVERAQQLIKGAMTNRSSQISELGMKYQQVSHKVKDLTSRWHQYVTSHQDFEGRIAECSQWLDDVRNKLGYCSDLSASSQKDLDSKMETIQDLLLYKEEGFSKVQTLVELAQTVLANTAPAGHQAINDELARLQDEWSALASKMVETKTILDDSIQRWSGFLEQIHNLNKTVEYLQSVTDEVSEFQATMSEKRAQLERIKCLEEKVRCEKLEVDSLKAKAVEMLASGQQSHAAGQAQDILNKFDTLADRIKTLLSEREEQYRDHRLYKEAHDELIGWLGRAREKVPSLKQRSLSDKLAIESALAPLEALLNKQAQGEMLLEPLRSRGEVALAGTSPPGQETIRSEIRALQESFTTLFKEIQQQKDALEATVVQWREYKEEYERLSDWLQQIDILVKAYKNALLATIPEKRKQVQEVKDVLKRLEDGSDQMERFNQTASSLLNSHLDTYVNNQLRHLNSRYQVQINLAKDVLKKVEGNLEQHEQYENYLGKTRAWIEHAKQVIRDSSDASSATPSGRDRDRDELQARLNQIQELLRRREEGQSLLHAAINWGEKTVRNTRSDGKDAINSALKELQTDWDRLVRKISTAKVQLETALLQWADYSSSYSQLQQWISDRENKLQQVCEQKVSKAKRGLVGQSAAGLSSLSIGERKATLRQTNSIVQDIVSFEPMIQSVASKAEDLLQAEPASAISTQYETLSKHAREVYEKQKETVEQHQAFIDAGTEFMQWIRAAKEKLGKCSEPTGDKESLSSKAWHLKVLQSETDEGQAKLQRALEAGEAACQVADEEEREVIEEEVALLQEELDTYLEQLARTKGLLEAGIVKWTDFEDQHKEASEWLSRTETLVQSFNRLQDGLEDKKNVLEQFQQHLQLLFDWQQQLDTLNLKAQVLLETCADSRVSNAVTQLTTKYNALLSLAKETMRRLEVQYQEHQQLSTLTQECQDWLERTRDKVTECGVPHATLAEVNARLQAVKAIRQSLEQGQNKLRYALELKEKVILNTEQSGAAKIQEDVENLKQEFEKLSAEVNELRQRLTQRQAQLEELSKAHKHLQQWLAELEVAVSGAGSSQLLNELSDKRAALEKLRSVLRDIAGHSDAVERLKARLAEDATLRAAAFQQSFDKYAALRDAVAANVATLEAQVREHEQYRQAYQEAVDWLRRARLEVQQCGDAHGDQAASAERQQRLQQVSATLPEGSALVQRCTALSEAVARTTGAEGCDTLHSEIQQLRDNWDSLSAAIRDTHRTLAACAEAWAAWTGRLERAQRWLDDFRARVAPEEQRGDENSPEDLERCRALMAEATQHKADIEELSDACEVLMELVAVSWVRDRTVQLQSAYSSLVTSVQGLVSRAQKNLSDYTEFVKAKTELESWLQRSHGTVQSCRGVGDQDWLRDKMDTVQLVNNRMTEGQHLMSATQEVFAKAVNTAPADRQDTLREDMAALRASWDQLSMELAAVTAQLKTALGRWDDHADNRARLAQWLDDTEASLGQATLTRPELGEMKTVLERYRHAQEEIAGKRVELTQLVTEATELSQWAGRQAPLEAVRALEKRWEELNTAYRQRRESLEREMGEYAAYQQAIQDTEKWILQVSFQLMAHNSLYITNRAQTQEQISAHQALLQDIRSYQATLDSVKSRGRAQVERYKESTPNIRTTIEKQLNNMQESYQSLLQTALQIEARLAESLAKFQQYEDTLDSIWANLDTFEQALLNQEADAPVLNLQQAQQQLEIARGMHNKLQGEKGRLAVAVQACEAAAACISRPSSPQDTVPPPIPDRELAVRARLEDLIDQVQGRVASLTSAVGSLEEWGRERAALEQWAAEQLANVTEWRARPAKLRPEAARQEMAVMQELAVQVTDKRTKLVTDLPQGPAGEDSDLEGQLASLDHQLQQVIHKKQEHQAVIDNFRASAQDLQSWLDGLLRRVEQLDRGGHDCDWKLAQLREIAGELNETGPARHAEVKALAKQVVEVVSNLDAQQVEEQMKAVDRRYGDVEKRLQRKTQVLELTRKGVESARSEIDAARAWVADKLRELGELPPLGTSVRAAEERQQALKALAKEAEGKQVLLDSLTKRVDGMKSELEPSELAALESALRSLEAEQADLRGQLRALTSALGASLEARRSFETGLEEARAWVRTRLTDLQRAGDTAPLKAAKVEREIQQFQQAEKDAEYFGKTTLADVTNQGQTLIKDCVPADKAKLSEALQTLADDFATLQTLTSRRLGSLSALLESRRQLETDMDRCLHWLNEAEVAISAEIRATNLELLQEQLTKYTKLSGECEAVGADVERLFVQGQGAVLSTVSEADRALLSEQLSGMQVRHAVVAGVIATRLEALRDAVRCHERALEKAKDSAKFVATVHSQLKELSRPIGSRVEDVQGLLDNYQKLLSDLKDHRSSLSGLAAGNIGELQAIVQEQDDLIAAIEMQIDRLRKLLLLREQFIALITEISTFILTYTGVVRDIEASGQPSEEKIKRYHDVIEKIQECEALLASAFDKGQMIASEGSAADRNSVTEQLQSLKNQLQGLRRAVDAAREQLEQAAAKHKHLAAQLGAALAWLHDHEAQVKSRPLLARDPASVDAQLASHQELSAGVLAHLDEVRGVLDAARPEDALPGSLRERLSEASLLLNTLPNELAERAAYLQSNAALRREHQALKDRLHAWVREARARLDRDAHGVDFRNVVSDLEMHKVFFGSEQAMRELLSHDIQQAADKIWPSLSAHEQEELTNEQTHLTQLLKNTLNSAKSRQAQLEQDAQVWHDYCAALERVRSLLELYQFTDEPVSNLAGLHYNLDKVTHAQQDVAAHQSDVDLLNERARELTRQADAANRAHVEQQIAAVNREWEEVVSGVEGRRDALARLAQQWEQFDAGWTSLEAKVGDAEDAAHHLDLVVRSKVQLRESRNTLQELIRGLEALQTSIDELVALSSTIVAYLSISCEPASRALRDKLHHFTERHAK